MYNNLSVTWVNVYIWTTNKPYILVPFTYGLYNCFHHRLLVILWLLAHLPRTVSTLNGHSWEPHMIMSLRTLHCVNIWSHTIGNTTLLYPFSRLSICTLQVCLVWCTLVWASSTCMTSRLLPRFCSKCEKGRKNPATYYH